MAIAGSGLDRPQARPSSEKEEPASAADQPSSADMVNSTTPSEVKVAAVTKKNASAAAANTSHRPDRGVSEGGASSGGSSVMRGSAFLIGGEHVCAGRRTKREPVSVLPSGVGARRGNRTPMPSGRGF